MVSLKSAARLAALLFPITRSLPADPVPPAIVKDAPRVVWQIGKEDHDYRDFALAGRYAEYKSKFPQDTIRFEIGKSNPSTDWPYVQPGTADGWGTKRLRPVMVLPIPEGSAEEQARTIQFTLADEPAGVFVLRIAIVDVNPTDPSVLTVAINGLTGHFSFNPGASSNSLLQAKPAGHK